MTVKRRKFKTEVQQLLSLVIHSLYTHREIFLRELLSNASDAVDRARFLALSDPTVMENDAEWAIRIIPDREARTLTISDNGIGMTAEEVEHNIGTIASSGTRHFIEQMANHDGPVGPELIGQFGVGFYSAFMVADKVTLVTRPAGDPETGVRWVSDGEGSYTLETLRKETRGTDVILHLKKEMDEYLDEWRIRKIVKQYSDFVEHPISMPVERQEKSGDGDDAETVTKVTEEVLNSRKAIWSRPRTEITDEEYNEFYRHISHDFGDPLKVIHWTAEGTTEFRSLLFLPSKAPFDLYSPDTRDRGVHLYVRRVFITDNCEALIPPYLRFLRGVVDSSDLPLNVSRETLQEERVIRIIRNNLVKKIIDTLREMQDKEADSYLTFWREFGKVLKGGVHLDVTNREKLQDLLMFQSSKLDGGTFTSLADYVSRMPEHQKDIYYLSGESYEVVAKSPLLETFRKRDIEVLFMTDPIDEWVTQSMTSFQEKPVKSIAKGDLDLEAPEDEKTDQEKEQVVAEYQELVAFLKDTLKDQVKDIRLSKRLTDSACCLVSDEADLGVHMEKILKAMQQDMPVTKRILEINSDHALIQAMRNMVKDKANHLVVRDYAELLYDQSLLTAGLPVRDSVSFARRISDLMATSGEKLAAQTPD